MTPLLVAVLTLLAMEPVVTLVHRRVMHGWAWGWHRSHHQRTDRALQANDLFPVVFAGATVAAMGLGATVDALTPLLWIGCGVTAYGAAYLVVHDLYIHQRLGSPPGARSRCIRRLAQAHRIHHRFGQAPYGFLLPVVPTDLRARAQRHPDRDAPGRGAATIAGPDRGRRD